ncbi:preprotein translocase subunit SecE [Thermosynechococcus sp. HN-54]|uniref:preprotein translocase subunit SecE n=1 Tax=Thermosynechococcus sp. HN-54 TaxID=2933959 RepID=UPI00202CC8F9|nr:preprotein translocase subunit SecE [Thermosynechococcus sp. HN-54]URR36008.1 preprotein translocase subunit SecE [Thermosynechococcus sp. HN-54]
MTKSTEGEKPTSGFHLTEFFRETKEELSKVVWPDRQRLIGESAAVILIVSLSAAVIYLVDELFRWLATLIF